MNRKTKFTCNKVASIKKGRVLFLSTCGLDTWFRFRRNKTSYIRKINWIRHIFVPFPMSGPVHPTSYGNGFRWEVIVRFIDIGRIVDHHCLLYCLSFFDLRLLITPLVSSNDYPFGIFKWLPHWYLQMIIPLVSSNDYPFGIFKWLPLWFLQMITPLVSSNDYPFGIFKWLPLWYLQMITPLVSSNDYTFGIFKWLPLWYLQMITPLVSSNDYLFGIFKWLPL
jgi:hypothetical protein